MAPNVPAASSFPSGAVSVANTALPMPPAKAPATPSVVGMRAPHASPLKLAPGPADVPGNPRKWSPPPPQDGIPLDERPEWLRDEALPFLELFERNVRKFPNKAAVTWVEEKGEMKQSYTYEEVRA
ncbi:unnamed protein product [Closterium sp. NIES-53]